MAGRDRWGRAVEVGNLFGQGVDMRFTQFPARLHVTEQLALRELTHFQRVFDGWTSAAELRGIDAAADRQYFKVEVLSQALIEAQLFLAEVFACAQLGEVEKAEIHRLLELVGKGDGEHHPGNMGFDNLELLYGMGVEGRVLQCGDQSLAHGRSLALY